MKKTSPRITLSQPHGRVCGKSEKAPRPGAQVDVCRTTAHPVRKVASAERRSPRLPAYVRHA